MFYTHLSKNSSIILNALKSNGLLSLDSMRKTDYQEYENFGNNQQFHFHKSAVCLLNFRQSEYYFSQGFEPKNNLFSNFNARTRSPSHKSGDAPIFGIFCLL